jgi:hypothetical protein
MKNFFAFFYRPATPARPPKGENPVHQERFETDRIISNQRAGWQVNF